MSLIDSADSFLQFPMLHKMVMLALKEKGIEAPFQSEGEAADVSIIAHLCQTRCAWSY